MAIKRKKISLLPLADSLIGLFTIGVDALNRSVKVNLQFLKTVADNANTAAGTANASAANANQAADSAGDAAAHANDTTNGLITHVVTMANAITKLLLQKSCPFPFPTK